MSKLVTVPVLVSVSVEIEDESLPRQELVDLAIAASQNVELKVNNEDVQKELGEGIYVDDFFEVQSYEKICEGNFYLGHISEVRIEDGW